MRPRVIAEIKGLKERLKEHIERVLEEKGAVSERELWEEALAFFSPEMKKVAEKFRKVYRTMYGRKIGKKTAEINVLENLRRLLSDIKKEIPHTEKQIVLGNRRFGRIFYAPGKEGMIAKKVREIIKGSNSRAEEVLNGIKTGPFHITPSYRKAVEMLAYYGLVEKRKIGNKVYAVEPGWEGEIEVEKREAKGLFPEHFKVWKPFVAHVLVLKEGPEKKSIKFDIAAWDPLTKIFYLGIVREYVSEKEVRNLITNYLLLHLPAKLVVFCKKISDGGKKVCGAWGIEIKNL